MQEGKSEAQNKEGNKGSQRGFYKQVLDNVLSELTIVQGQLDNHFNESNG